MIIGTAVEVQEDLAEDLGVLEEVFQAAVEHLAAGEQCYKTSMTCFVTL